MKYALPLLLLTLGAATACARPAPPLPPDPALVAIYCDLAMAAGDAGPAAPDSVRMEIFKRHGTSQEAFEAALDVYRRDPRGWLLFFRAVSDTFDARILRRYPRGALPSPRIRPPGPG